MPAIYPLFVENRCDRHKQPEPHMQSSIELLYYVLPIMQESPQTGNLPLEKNT